MAGKSKSGNDGNNEKAGEAVDLARLEKQAANVADIFGEDQDVSTVVHAAELDGQEIIITGFKRLTGGTGEYFFLYAFRPGERELFGFTCGGGVIMEKLDKVQEKQAFPLRVRWTMKQPASGGRAYYDIVQV